VIKATPVFPRQRGRKRIVLPVTARVLWAALGKKEPLGKSLGEGGGEVNSKKGSLVKWEEKKKEVA